jgi:hypothetical protein
MTVPIYPPPCSVKDFASSQEAAFRRTTRDTVRRSNLTRTEKEILLAFLNHWFVRRHKGPVHPGRKKLAKKAKASVRAVNYTLSMLRDFGVITAVAYATGNAGGEKGRATEYEVDTSKLLIMCAIPAKALKSIRKGANSGISGCKNARLKGAQIAPRNNNGTIIPFRIHGVGK